MNRTLACLFLGGLSLLAVNATQTKYFTVVSVIQNHFAETTMESEVVNDENTTAQVKFHIMLPKEAYISSFIMTIDGETYDAVIEEKQKAKKKFTEARRRGHTAGLVETREKADKIFSTDVNIGAYATVSFKFVYQQLLKSVGGKYTDKIILFGDSLSEHLTVDVYICEASAITDVEVLPILLNNGGGNVDSESSTWIDGNSAHVRFTGNDEILNSVVARGGGVFSVVYKLDKSQDAANIVVDNGHFIYFGPDIPIQPKRVIFCLDDSGSMMGHKSQQVKDAMTNILDKLLPQDRFGIVKFSSSTRTWRSRLSNGTRDDILSAKTFVKGRDESGSTGIWRAFREALTMMAADQDPSRPSIPQDNLIILLSDGHGDLGGTILLNNVNKMNNNRFTIHTISFGNGADDSLLKRVANENLGRWKKILSDLDSALQIENYVDELRTGAISIGTEVIKYPDVVEETFDVLQTSEVMSVGKFKEDLSLYNNGPYDITFDTGKVSSEPGMITTSFYLDQASRPCQGMDGKQIQRFTEKAFAMTKVEQLLDSIVSATSPEEKEQLKQKAINMSIEFHLVTSVTSLLVIKPEDDQEIENSLKQEPTEQPIAATTTTTPQLNQPYVAAAAPAPVASRAYMILPHNRWSLHSDPHIIARLSDDVTVCFDWIGRDNEVINLLHDYNNSIVINGLLTDGNRESSATTSRLFVTNLVFLLPDDDLKLEIDCNGMSISNLNPDEAGAYRMNISLPDDDRRTYFFGIVKIHIVEIKYQHHIIINVRIKKSLFVVEIQYKNAKPTSLNHLDLIIPDYGSEKVGGVFGRLSMEDFVENGRARIVPGKKPSKMVLLYNGDKMQVRHSSMKLPYLQERVPCWLVKGHLQHLFGSKLGSFKLRSLFDIPN